MKSAGILLFQCDPLRVLLVHPGGPFWARRDDGAWSIPKGEYGDDEDAEAAALRECAEELNAAVTGPLIPLGDIRQKAGKIVTAFACEAPFDVTTLSSNLFDIEWPPKSGRRQTFPEVDRAAWLGLNEARQKILPAQAVFLDRLSARLEKD